jgi:hypothetical protein
MENADKQQAIQMALLTALILNQGQDSNCDSQAPIDVDVRDFGVHDSFTLNKNRMEKSSKGTISQIDNGKRPRSPGPSPDSMKEVSACSYQSIR